MCSEVNDIATFCIAFALINLVCALNFVDTFISLHVPMLLLCNCVTADVTTLFVNSTPLC